ncbi:MAG: glucose-6-phosphate dehydrogenase assembly protein OpcA [Frankiaceae bacterium]|jgi:glucose-6-phosphate dehydrogenase assembly protein OpcA|nr:glucose-6-phosphate dehydrogenase assembly protein OpcA [Frankiaceae bacterium]
MTTLWDTTGTAVVKALAAERRTGGAVTSGIALTLVVAATEENVAEAEAAAAIAASKHPTRVLVVIRREISALRPRLDAEVLIGGRLGPGEAIVMRMHGRLALHPESVTLPLLAPDAPVVTWWHDAPPHTIAWDPLGVFADRRITECGLGADPVAALRRRAEDYATGDTDLAWSAITGWRALIASAFDSATAGAASVTVTGDPGQPSPLLLAGWRSDRLGRPVPVERDPAGGDRADGLSAVSVEFDDGARLVMLRDGQRIVLRRSGQPDGASPLPDRQLGDLVAEELRRLDPDQTYAGALGAATGSAGLAARPSMRAHIWHDPAEPPAAASPAAPSAPDPSGAPGS